MSRGRVRSHFLKKSNLNFFQNLPLLHVTPRGLILLFQPAQADHPLEKTAGRRPRTPAIRIVASPPHRIYIWIPVYSQNRPDCGHSRASQNPDTVNYSLEQNTGFRVIVVKTLPPPARFPWKRAESLRSPTTFFV